MLRRTLLPAHPRLLLSAALALGLAACAPQNPNWANELALRAGAPRPDAPLIRERQSTRLKLRDEVALLSEVTQVLQDLGYTVEESAPELGVLAGSKERDATEAGQVAAQIAVTVGLALLGVRYQPIWDKDQLIRVTVSTLPQPAQGDVRLRVSFERIVVNNPGQARAEMLDGAEFSHGFFQQVRSGLATRGISL
jgi:hypothetical protein